MCRVRGKVPMKRRPSAYEFCIQKIATIVLFGIIDAFVSLFLYIFSNSVQPLVPLLVLPVCFISNLIFQILNFKNEDIPSKCYNPELLPHKEYLALKQKLEDAENGKKYCSNLSGITDEEKTEINKSYQETIDDFSPILNAQNNLRILCLLKMNFGYVSIPAVEFDDGEEGTKYRNAGIISENEDNFSSDKNNDSFFNEKTTSIVDGEISSENGVNETIVKSLQKSADIKQDEIHENKIAEIKAEESIKQMIFSENESNIENANRFERTILTESQLEILETEFLKTPFPDIQMKKEISLKTGLPQNHIQNWFRNQRAKIRRQERSEILEAKQDEKSSCENGNEKSLRDAVAPTCGDPQKHTLCPFVFYCNIYS